MNEAEAWRRYLCELGRAVRDRLVREVRQASEISQENFSENLADEVAEEGGDVIFRLDRHAEHAMLAFLDEERRRPAPFRLIAEGINHGELRVGAGAAEVCVICDPVDGSRGLMYDKRPGWFLAAAAPERPDRAGGARLSEIFAAAMIELPTSKQGWADEFSVAASGGLIAHRANLASQSSRPITPRPSGASSLRGGFGQVVNFFPGTKVLAAELMERISEAVVGPVEAGRANVFDDQYICSGGQMVELIMGRDRFCCDLRPLLDRIRERRIGSVSAGLACHPYDLSGRLVAERAGVILTNGFGEPLDAPMNVTDPVHWCGFANESLRDAILPVIRQWLAEHGIHPTS